MTEVQDQCESLARAIAEYAPKVGPNVVCGGDAAILCSGNGKVEALIAELVSSSVCLSWRLVVSCSCTPSVLG